MRLTVLRQSPTDISRQENSGHPKATPEHPNGTCPQLLCNYRLTSLGTGASGHTGRRSVPYDSVRAPGIPACPYPLTSTAITNNTSQSYPNSPHNASKTLAPKETNGELRHSARRGRPVTRHHALSRRRRSTPTRTINISDNRRLVDPPPPTQIFICMT